MTNTLCAVSGSTTVAVSTTFKKTTYICPQAFDETGIQMVSSSARSFNNSTPAERESKAALNFQDQLNRTLFELLYQHGMLWHYTLANSSPHVHHCNTSQAYPRFQLPAIFLLHVLSHNHRDGIESTSCARKVECWRINMCHRQRKLIVW